MKRYHVVLYRRPEGALHRQSIKCDKQEIPFKVAGIVLDYLKGTPCPEGIHALVTTYRNTFTYVIKVLDDTVTVYHQVLQGSIEDMEE